MAFRTIVEKLSRFVFIKFRFHKIRKKLHLKLSLRNFTPCSVFAHFIGERFAQLHHHIRLELPERINFPLDLLILRPSLLQAILCVQLRISTLIYVVKDLQRYMEILDVVLKFVNFLQICYKGLATEGK